MRKDRNTFFTNYSAQNQSYVPNFPTQNQQFGPYQAANTQSSFYAGPDIGYSNDLENRLSKIERQINRLDARVSKLENAANIQNIPSNDSNYQNMYMI